MTKYVAPSIQLDSFSCPVCSAYAHQIYRTVMGRFQSGSMEHVDGIFLTRCAACAEYSIWKSVDGSTILVYPTTSAAPLAIDGTPESVLLVYEEARLVFATSPRAAAALLRLSLEVLLRGLSVPGKDINEQIATLVKQGLSDKIQRGMDVLRVVGNNAVHPGTMDINDNREMALHLFELINICVDALVVQPKRIDDLFSSLPGSARGQIERRDKK